MNSVHHLFTMIESECSCEHKWKQKGFQVVSIDSTQSSCRSHSRLECWLENLLLYWEGLPTAWIFITGIFLTKNFQTHQMYTCFLFQIKVLLTDIIPYRKQTNQTWALTCLYAHCWFYKHEMIRQAPISFYMDQFLKRLKNTPWNSNVLALCMYPCAQNFWIEAVCGYDHETWSHPLQLKVWVGRTLLTVLHFKCHIYFIGHSHCNGHFSQSD